MYIYNKYNKYNIYIIKYIRVKCIGTTRTPPTVVQKQTVKIFLNKPFSLNMCICVVYSLFLIYLHAMTVITDLEEEEGKNNTIDYRTQGGETRI